MILIKKMYFKQFWQEKISEIIFCFDPSNFALQLQYCRLGNLKGVLRT